MNRFRSLSIAAFFVAATPIGAPVIAAESEANGSKPVITVYKSPSCGCCDDWVDHIENNGFKARVEDTNRINAIKQENGLPREMASCHTALIDGYVIEGHVPAEDIHAFLDAEERAFGEDTLGLAVPRMPHGSPGMETGRQDDYKVFAFTADGETDVFQSYSF
ncbi:CopG family transcriptional regulator [Halovibrio salipaludis]|uniref:CopG family transcriptional regulator n=1 Tax=Halovibrio salipaludis TaxID=2032626 RepID=A0A2A2F5Y6_9GAMM|nr:DUF411 domain-containing protein [Halovibrio salipaludis]PAU80348.1 CopG family transcriptional regulator [Halovibrio salipaludis]